MAMVNYASPVEAIEAVTLNQLRLGTKFRGTPK